MKSTDITLRGAAVHFIPIQNRVPLKFGSGVVTSVTCVRVKVWVEDQAGSRSEGWGETPLSVQWVWPSSLDYETRHQTLKDVCLELADAWAAFGESGHPIELGHDFQASVLPKLLRKHPQMPWLAALVCCSAFDIALHDAYGHSLKRSVYETYNREFMNRDLSSFLEPDSVEADFKGRYPAEFLRARRCEELDAWHLVGGLDPLTRDDLTGAEPADNYPVLLDEWIQRDGLNCLKIKLRGNDADWDYGRLTAVGKIAIAHGSRWLTADYNCTVTEPSYVVEMLDRLEREFPQLHRMLLYVEQPFPYELEEHRTDVRSVSARKPLFLDESAHDWKMVRLGRQLGWTGVALKTCKTQTGAILSACWARAHKMDLMVQDLTNPMLAQIPHLLLAAHVDTIMGVETNSMQFYPEASTPEAKVHPGIYRRRGGMVNLSTVQGPGFGYAGAEQCRDLKPFHVVLR